MLDAFTLKSNKAPCGSIYEKNKHIATTIKYTGQMRNIRRPQKCTTCTLPRFSFS